MSAFTKPPNDGTQAGGPKPEGQPAKPSAPQKPPGPSIVVTRTIDVGPSASQKPRPPAPAVNVGPPAARPAAPPMPNVQPPAAQPAPARAQPSIPQPPPTQPHLSPPTHAQAAPAQAQPLPATKATLKMEAPPTQSVRPSAPPLALEEGVASIADTFERLLSSDLDRGFDAIERQPGSPPTIEGLEITDLAEVRSLFAQLASNHVRPVRDFLMDLRWGEATIEWIDVCVPALKSLRRAADKLELADLCTSLDAFSAALSAAKSAGSRTIEGDARTALLTTHEKLAEVMPQAFALDLDRSQRESVILQSLLLQVPEVKKVTIDKLYAAGLTTLEAMLLANPGDVAATTGLDETVAARIVARFRDYHSQVRAAVPDATRTPERERIAQLTAQLKTEHDDFEVASRSWSREAGEKKKELRAARARTLLDIQVLLARLGEVERLKELERLPFDKKVAHLESFLEEARDKYVGQA
jgi:hypothetical protein